MRNKKDRGPETAERLEEHSPQKEILDKRRKDKQKPSKKEPKPPLKAGNRSR